MKKKIIKNAPIVGEVEKMKKKEDLKQDIAGFFGERDKTKRGLAGRIDDIAQLSEVELEIKEKVYEDSLIEVPVPKHIEPMFNSLLVTAKKNKVTTESGILLAQTVNDSGLEIDYQEIQTVMAIGPQTQQVQVGQSIVINFENFRSLRSDAMVDKVEKNTKLKVPIQRIEGVNYIMISERDIKYINNNLK
jgi:co-chaperonin GroES (HSP10)